MPSSSLAPMARDDLVWNAWNHYVESDRIDIQIVRSEIADSWQRYRSLRVDPFQAVAVGIDEHQGGEWSEPARGTNAIAMAIMEKKPVQVYACEHYCRPHYFLSCSASPISAADGSMAGVLDMSGDYRAINSHTLGMVAAAASAIELPLQMTTKEFRPWSPVSGRQ